MALYAFGCSLTFGDSLRDIHPNRDNPSNLAWPSVLARRLDTPVRNLGKCSNSNMQIAWEIAAAVSSSPDISHVAVLWSFPNRLSYIPPQFFNKQSKDYKKTVVNIKQPTDKSSPRLVGPATASLKEMMTIYYADLHHADADSFFTLVYMFQSHCVLKAHGIPHVFSVAGQKNYDALRSLNETHDLRLMPDVVMMENGWGLFDMATHPDTPYPPAMDDLHPGADAHAAFGEKLAEAFA